MSILQDILTSAEKLTLDDINRIAPEVKQKIDDLKNEAAQYSENIYVKYSERPKKNKVMLDTCRQVESEINLLKTTGLETKEKLLNAANDLDDRIESIHTVDFKLLIVAHIIKINKGLIDFVDFLDSEDYLACMKIIHGLEETVINIPEDQYVDAYDILKIKINDRKEMLIRDLKNTFTENVSITQNKESGFTFKVTKDHSNVEQALLALYYHSSVAYPLHKIAKLLWNHFFVPIIDNVVKLEIKESIKSYALSISILDASKKSNYKVVFANLELLLNYMKKNFYLKLDDAMTTLEYVGIDIRDNLSELLVKHCLEDTIPSTQEGLQNYKAVISDIEKLETTLKACRIFDVNTTSIVDYANNIDILFINKKCNEYLQQAQQIMKKNLYEIIEVGVPYNHENPLRSTSEDFLQCSVSKSVIELLDFIEKIIEQAISASEECAGRLFYTVQNIVTRYAEFVPEYHKKLLQTIPQQVALFYNDCYYIAHTLFKWNNSLCPNLPGLIGENRFESELDEIVEVASKIFTDYVKGQIEQINTIMTEACLDVSTLEELQPNTEKCVRQCLRQQELLKTVWHKVLSYPIYNETIGKILNTLCTNIITRIVKFEDISSNAAEQFIEVLKIIMVRGPKLFTDAKEVSLYVPLWYKLGEVNFVLGASLLDINDRWADGKGPLALQFKPFEVKSLIRALFQNTDRRSAVLAKIIE